MEIVSCKLMGGLGNMLFQIASTYSLSLRDNKKMICDVSDVQMPHKPYTFYTDNILRNVTFSNSLPVLDHIREVGFHYTPLQKVTKNVKLFGYFQSEKYFVENRHEILELFKIDERTKHYLLQKYDEIINQNTCSIHIRRGDYVRLSAFHPIQTIDYYKQAIQIVGEENHFLIFSDDINWCKENLSFIKNKTFIDGNEDFQDLYLMSMCKNNIIANSSFSWWGAWLNLNEDKKVVSPKMWFGEKNKHLNTKDIYCEKWITI
jgi:hypothetical protein